MKKTEQEGFAYINRRISAAFLLICLASVYVEEAQDEAQRFGGFKHRLKHNIEKAKKGMEDFQAILRHEADTQGKQMLFFKDFERLEKMVSNFINIDNEEYGCIDEKVGGREIGSNDSPA